MKDFRELKVWQKSHQLVLAVYQATAVLPKEELYGLTGQVRRSSVSIAANIAEGCGRGSDADFGRFLQMAMGSASETEYHLLLCRDLRLLANPEYESLRSNVEEVKRMMTGLLKKIRTSSQPPMTEG
jgi:four helix bundle protein